MITNHLTVAEKLLLATLELRKRNPTFTAEDLVVEAWKLYPDAFGLSGYAERFPDSNRVLTNIMGTKGMRGKGWLRKVGEKRYQLSSTGLRDGESLSSRVWGEGKGESADYLRAELDRQVAASLDRMFGTGAALKALGNTLDSISFLDACGFWDITVRSNANTLNLRLRDAGAIIDQALGALGGKSESERLKLPSGVVTKDDIRVLAELHAEMQERFRADLDIIRKRTDERSEKRSRPM